MRETWSTLQTKCQGYTRDESSGALTFLKNEMNAAQRFIYDELESYVNKKTKTSSTKADYQYYYYPRDCLRLENLVVTIGDVDYVCDPVHSPREWDRLNAIQFQAEGLPAAFFPRRDSFGIWPIPQDAYTMTLRYVYALKDLSQDDYNTGTITVTNNDETITGSGTTFTAGMEDRYLKADDDGYWYKIESFTSTTSLELNTVYQGSTASGESFTIGESPDLPASTHVLLAEYATMMYFAGYRQNDKKFKTWSNKFWTGDPSNDSRNIKTANGGLLGAKRRYSRRSESSIIRKRGTGRHLSNTSKLFAYSVTDPA